MSDALRDAARAVLPLLYNGLVGIPDTGKYCRGCGLPAESPTIEPHAPACPVAALERALNEPAP